MKGNKNKRRTNRFRNIIPTPPTATVENIDYKNVALLSGYVSETGKILSSRLTRISAKKQRKIAQAIKRARFLALMPYSHIHKL